MLTMNHSLPPRPHSPHFNPVPSHQPRSICRNYVFNGICKNPSCPRAHVPHNDMIDLLLYLTQREDCPPELRFPKGYLNPPRFHCTWEMCTRTHFSIGRIYDSLLGANRAQPREDATTVLLVTPVDPTTRPIMPMNANNEQPVVKLPQAAGPAESIPFEHDPPLDVVVQPPKLFLPDSETTPSGSVDPEHPQSSPTVPSLDAVAHPHHPAGQSPTLSNQPLDVERQEEKSDSSNRPPIVSEESPAIEPSSGSDSTTDDVSDPGLLTPATASPPLKALGQPPRPRRCGRCGRPPGKCNHGIATLPHPKNIVGCAKPPSSARTERKQPLKGPPAQANIAQVTSRHNTIPTSKPVGSTFAKPAQQIVENVSPNLKAEACATLATVPATAVLRDPAVVAAHFGPTSQPLAQPSLTSHRMAAQAPPTPLHNTRLPQCSRPRGLHDQSALPRHSPDEFTLSVMDSTQVTLSGGFSITKIITKMESLWFTIENVPVNTQCATIAHIISPFGEVKNVRTRDGPALVFEVTMATYREAVSAINGLDGREIPDFLGHRLHLSLPRSVSNRMLRDTYVRASWPVPCKTGYAGYSTLEAAQNAVSKADGLTKRKHWITANVYDGIPILGAYNVRFTGLPADVEATFLDKFGPTEGTMYERANYQAPKFGIPAVRRTLESFGKIAEFNENPPPYKQGKVSVWCRFESPDVANAACELHRVKQRSLGMEKISVVRSLSALERVPRAKFDLVEQDLHILQENVHNHIRGAYLNILSHGEEDGEPAVRLVAEDSKTLARLRIELSEILAGEIVKENGQQVWDDFLRGEAGSRFLDDLRARNSSVMISVHFFHRYIRLIGTAKRRRPVVTAIISRLSLLRQHKVRSIPLGGKLIGVFFGPELMAAQQRYGVENINLDIQKQLLHVRGPETLYEEIQQLVHMVESRQAAKPNVDHCPVCFDPPVTPIHTSCGHKWCKSCLDTYLSAAADSRSFPISCLGNQGKCTALIPVRSARFVLNPTNFDALVLAAFHAYVQARPNEYHYCPTPDCPQAYPTGPRNSVISCPSCYARICPSCHVEYHEGVTCADREDGGDRLFQEWMRGHDVKNCPGCAAPIERAEGCNHMTCTRCHTHTCWVCLETFPQGQGIYSHMREFHGGIGL